jgi:translation initiation factor 3 subunit H
MYACRLQVTNCFPFPNRDDDENSEDTGAEYQLEMMRCMREVNVDNNTVGWYQSAYLGSYVNESMVETQFNYQQNLKKSVVMVFDPVLSTESHLSLKAFRLTDAFMTLFAGRKFTADALKEAQMDFSKVFEEVPIEIHNAHLCRALLFELESEEYFGPHIEPNLDLPATSVLEKNLEFLIEYGDHLSADHSKLQYHQRALHRQRVQQSRWVQQRKSENTVRRRDGKPELSEVPEPSQFEKVTVCSWGWGWGWGVLCFVSVVVVIVVV